MNASLLKLAACLTLALAVAPAVQAADIVVPGANATKTGGSNQDFPFNLPAGTSQRYQQLYLGSEFGTAPITLYAIKFRQASDANGGKPFSTTLSSITLNLSTAATKVGAASSTFATNVGVDNATVFSGALSLSSTAPALKNATPQPFDIVINFANPFTYDPTKGDLLLDVFNFGGGLTTQFDFITGGSTSVSRVVGSQGAVGASGAFFVQQGAGLVTAFSTTPQAAAVPEPASWAMMMLGFGLAGAAMRRRGIAVATA